MKIPAWTYSQLDSFESCPRKFYHLRVARDIVEPPSEYSEWGTRVHTALEERVLNGTPLPEGMTQWEKLAAGVEKLPGVKECEKQMALDDNFQPAEWKEAWTRGIADVVVVNGSSGAVLDYKTGKRKPSEQLRLYAAYMFAYFPELQKVNTGFIWLRDKRVEKVEIHRDQVPVIWQEFLPRYKRLLSAYEREAWPPRPSGLCKAWCPCTGCEFNGKKNK